jgi:hypothetical protein
VLGLADGEDGVQEVEVEGDVHVVRTCKSRAGFGGGGVAVSVRSVLTKRLERLEAEAAAIREALAEYGQMVSYLAQLRGEAGRAKPPEAKTRKHTRKPT